MMNESMEGHPNPLDLSDLSLDQVCEKLDLLLIRHLELSQEYLDLSLKGQVYQREGYLNLAKARYIEGSHSMSKMRLPTEDSEEYDAVIKVITGVEVEVEQDDLLDLGKKSVRSLSIEPASSENSIKLLRQFGLLSPSSVKIAQRSFRQNLDLCVDRVNVVEELGRVQKQFRWWYNVKNVFIKKNNGMPEP